MASLEILTEIEPITIMYTRNDMTWYDLSVNILAIVGGSVATIGVVNMLSHFLIGIKWLLLAMLEIWLLNETSNTDRMIIYKL